MSSWIPSLFNPFSDGDNPTSPTPSSSDKTTPRSPPSGAKEDLSAVFRGVAAFLVPQQTTSSLGPSSSSLETITGIKNDLAEIQGSFKSGLSLISSKLTSNFLQFQSQLNDDENDEVEEEEDEDAVGMNEDVVDFVGKISGRPELWTDFPLSLPDDFDMSDHQREHAAIIDHLVPEFVTLRQKTCSQISHGKFWLIYYILLLPRLNNEDLKLLSTPEVVEARETLLKKLQNKTDLAQENSGNQESSDTNKDHGNGYSKEGGASPSLHKDVAAETVDTAKQRDIVNEIESGYYSEQVDTCTSVNNQKQSESEEDVSFSDLEDDDNNLSANKLSGPKVSKSEKVWIQLNDNSGAQGATPKADQSAIRDKESEGEESNDWLTVDDTDFDNLAAI